MPTPRPRRHRRARGLLVLVALFIGVRLISSIRAGPGGTPLSTELATLCSIALGGVIYIVLPVLGVRELLFYLYGLKCPRCGGGALARVAVCSFAERYYRCPACGARLKRVPLGDWQEADGKEDAAYYEPRSEAASWVVEPWDEQDAALGSKAIDRLVSSQRRRKGAS